MADCARPRPEAIAIVGNVNIDIKTSVIAAGPAIMSDGETAVAEIHETIGGGGANTAVAAALMGGRVHFCGCIGNDDLGSRLVRYMTDRGIVPHVAVKPVATGRSIALTWDDHHRHFISSLPNNRSLTESDVNVDRLAGAGCRHLYRADVWFSAPMLFGGNTSLLDAARARGMETSLDLNWDPCWSDGRDASMVAVRINALRATLPSVSFVHGNERELMFFTGAATVQDAARDLVESGAGAVIIHRGRLGSAAFWNGVWTEAPAASVSRIVSESGSGDVFTAAFLLHCGLPVPELLRVCGQAAADHLQGTPSYIPPLPDGAPSIAP